MKNTTKIALRVLYGIADGAIDAAAEKAENGLVKDSLTLADQFGGEIVEALTDNNDNDKEQVLGILNDNKEKIVDFGTDVLRTLAQQNIKDATALVAVMAGIDGLEKAFIEAFKPKVEQAPK